MLVVNIQDINTENRNTFNKHTNPEILTYTHHFNFYSVENLPSQDSLPGLTI